MRFLGAVIVGMLFAAANEALWGYSGLSSPFDKLLLWIYDEVGDSAVFLLAGHALNFLAYVVIAIPFVLLLIRFTPERRWPFLLATSVGVLAVFMRHTLLSPSSLVQNPPQLTFDVVAVCLVAAIPASHFLIGSIRNHGNASAA